MSSLHRSEDPENVAISSVITQAGVLPAFSGASIVSRGGEIVTEGVRGSGEAFMLGARQTVNSSRASDDDPTLIEEITMASQL